MAKALRSESPTSARAETPDDPLELLHYFFPNAFTAPFAPHHEEFWAWVWALEKGVRPDPYINIWPRGGGKTISNECAVVVAGHRRTRRNVLIVSETQPQADKIVSNIATRLESRVIATADPDLSARALNKYGTAKGWRRNRLTTASGLTVQGIGILGAVRGLREEDERPDLIIFDDVDNKLDSLGTTPGARVVALDVAVNHGPGRLREWLAEGHMTAAALTARRLEHYTGLSTWEHFGKGWARRAGRTLAAAERLEAE